MLRRFARLWFSWRALRRAGDRTGLRRERSAANARAATQNRAAGGAANGSTPAATGTTPAAADTQQKPPSFFPFTLPFGKGSDSGGSGASSQQASLRHQAARAADKVSAYLSGVQTMVGNFVQIGPDGRRTEGTFYIQKPGKVRFEYNAPSPIDIIADGSSVVVRDRKLATQDLYPLSQTPLRYLLADHIDLMRDTNVVSVTSDDMLPPSPSRRSR